MTTDQLLLAHSVGSGRFEISGLRTISIRDQMLRARLIVDRLVDEKLIAPQYPLLVIGGGAGGATAALRAAESKIPVYLCEKGPLFFDTQSKAERWLDPTQYDWPALHWARGSFNQRAFKAALPWQAARSDRLAQRWELEFLNALSDPLIHVVRPLRIVRADIGMTTFRGRQVVSCCHFGEIDFGAALSCVGFGSEKTGAGLHFKGFDFWDADPYELPAWGLTARTGAAVISGGGDGALQDFLRLLMGSKQPSDIIHLLEQRKIAIDYASILRAEDVAHRNCLWAPPGGDTHGTLQEWHNQFCKVVDEVWRSMSAADRTALQDCLLPEVRRGTHRVLLVHGCNHFGYCYALNRFVALLMAKAYEEDSGIHFDDIIRWGSSVAGVQGVNRHHVCGNPSTCHDVDHEVAVVPRACTGEPSNVAFSAVFNVIVVRHGVNFSPLFDDAPFPKQYLAYDVF